MPLIVLSISIVLLWKLGEAHQPPDRLFRPRLHEYYGWRPGCGHCLHVGCHSDGTRPLEHRYPCPGADNPYHNHQYLRPGIAAWLSGADHSQRDVREQLCLFSFVDLLRCERTAQSVSYTHLTLPTSDLV